MVEAIAGAVTLAVVADMEIAKAESVDCGSGCYRGCLAAFYSTSVTDQCTPGVQA